MVSYTTNNKEYNILPHSSISTIWKTSQNLDQPFLPDEKDTTRLRLYLLYICFITTLLSYFANLKGLMACAEDYYAE